MKFLAAVFALGLVSEAFRVALFARSPVHPDFLLGIVVLVSLKGTSTRGAMTGFLVGLIRDIFYGTPVGCEAFPMALIGWVVGSLGRSVYRDAMITHVVVIFTSALARGLVEYVVLRGGEITGIVPYGFRVVLPGAALTAFSIPLLYRAFLGLGDPRDWPGLFLERLRDYERKILVKR